VVQPLPSNQLTALISAFSSALTIDDVRYDISIYGPFFKEIPRRLGKNEALDASASALTTALVSVHRHQQTPDMYEKYAEALKALRIALNDPSTSEQPETLLSMYLITICQVR
jgi:hypothetical protein